MFINTTQRLWRLTFLCLLALLCQQALSSVRVTGRIASATDDTPLPGATVRLLLLPDSTMLIGSYSDTAGHFALTSSRVKASAKKPVKVLLVASYMGYQTAYKQVNARDRSAEFDLKDVYLQEETHLLGEAVVSAIAPPVIIKGDTIEYFADSYKTQPDATVEDLLKRLPGVEVDESGSVTAQGETVQQVYVDGKEFFGRNTQVTTRNLTADMVETVQVVDMQTDEARLTGIDDGERRKVINLKLKPKMRRGWFGNGAGGWGMGRGISDRFDTRGTVGYFRGNMQNALVFNANNTNNAGFGDLGDGVMNGSAMRGNRQSGRRGDGLNTSWSVGLNLNYDKGNRMRDPNTPFALGGDVNYGGSRQEESSRSHRINYLSSGNTVSDNINEGDNTSQNVQFNMKFERSWGDYKVGQHRIQVSPSLSFNSTSTTDYSESHTGHEYIGDDGNATGLIGSYISQTQRRNEISQHGFKAGLNASYSYTKQTERGRRMSSISLNVSEQLNEGDQYTRSYTTYDTGHIDFDRFADITALQFVTDRDTLINQWQQEDSHQENYRLRITHTEPITEGQFVELSATANLSERYNTHTYHFWDPGHQAWSDTIGTRTNASYNSDTESNTLSYTLTASWRRVTEMYNLQVGMDFLPQTQRYTDYLDHTRDYRRSFVNYSPRMEYRYNWSRRTNLRITLNGATQQPSANQLQARKNQISATHVSLGNKNLDPSYSTSFTARYRTFNDETYVTYEASLSARAGFNNLVSKRWYSEDLRTDTTMTVNLNGIGNWNVQGEFRGSWPFYDNLWYVTSNSSLGYNEAQGYASIRSTDSQVNTSRNYTGSEQAGIAYRGEKLNVELRGNYRVQHSTATIVTSGNLGTTHNFGVSSHITAHLPLQFIVSSDFSYTARRGYSAGLTRNQSIWNAQLSRVFTWPKYSISTFIRVNDILRQKSNISRNVSATSLTDRETTVLGQYFIVGASLKFNRMGGRRGGRGGFQGEGSEGRRM